MTPCTTEGTHGHWSQRRSGADRRFVLPSGLIETIPYLY